MYLVKNKKAPILALLFRICGLLVGLTAITLQFVTNSVIGKGFMANHVLAYFTLQTNIISSGIFLALIIKTIISYKKERRLKVVDINKSLHLACTFYITITMTVYWAVLVPMLGVGEKPLTIFNALFLHLFMPIMAIIDCLLFFDHGSLDRKDACKWLTYPVLYLILIIIIANVSDIPYYKFPMGDELIPLRYPYPFIDPQVVGRWGMIGVIAGLLILVVLFGLLYIFIDKKIGSAILKRENKVREQREKTEKSE